MLSDAAWSILHFSYGISTQPLMCIYSTVCMYMRLPGVTEFMLSVKYI